jgi:hypothetical protein
VRKICADTLHHVDTDNSWDRTEAAPRRDCSFSRLSREASITDSVPEFDRSVRSATMGRAFFITEQGKLGLGPVVVSPGDEICILVRGFVPFALRPNPRHVAGSSDTKFLKGDCYVHGIMNGEAMEIDYLREEVITLV